jgi:hypothetical protein
MRVRLFAGITLLCLAVSVGWGRDVDVSSVSLSNLTSSTVDITYTLTRTLPTIAYDQPIWIYVKYTSNGGSTWMDTDNTDPSDDWGMGGMTGASTVNLHLNGDADLVPSGGSKTITWTWGTGGTNLTQTDQVKVRVYAVEMCRVDQDGLYQMGGDAGLNAITSGTANIALSYLQKYPVTNRMYVDFLNEVANLHDNSADSDHDYWNATQGDATRGGINIISSVPTAVWSVVAGREDWPVIGVNWLNAYDMLRWMGLKPPCEEQWEKACRFNGLRYSWGDSPAASTTYCNMSGTFSPGRPCDVNTFQVVWYSNAMENNFGLFEMTGNVWEWTDTQSYTGAYDVSKSGLTYASPPANIVVRGGSWGVSGTSLYGSARALNTAYNARNTFTGIRGAKP